jgi:two-component system chemotaxis sensor kinase CheA
VRIQVEDLDSLIASAHELFGQTVSALDLVSSGLSADSQVELKNLDAQIRESLSSLEQRIIQLRMVSLDRIMQRAVRAGRVAAKVRDKEINFMTVGGDLHIDKTLLDAVADPLLHLVRNAVDQGIELPAARVAAGKPAAGLVRIEASSVGGRVRFVVSDNGRGIDPQVISAAAARLGIIEEGTLLSDEKSLRLIFRPGFSTATEVSSVSGRGVGLDIVEKAIEKVGGSVRVRTKVGSGSEFEIRLPTSLGVMRAVVLRSGDFRYCVDASLVVDRCASNEIVNDSLEWQAETLPVVPLRSLVSQTNGQRKPDTQVLICAFPSNDSDKTRRAIAVDSIEATPEILVRSLGRHGAMWPGIVGATELFDGTVALVLDLPLLLSQK